MSIQPLTASPMAQLSSHNRSKQNSESNSATNTVPHSSQTVFYNVQTYIKELEISEGQLSSVLK
jgi:hypothetical protein